MRALLSVSDKTGLVDLGRGLAARDVELVSTGGTARALAEAGLGVTAVSDVTGFPEMMDGRVKTLHPKVHGGILARRDREDDLAAIAAQGIEPIDVVVVNLYPFARAAAAPDTSFDELIEQIDIGGPSMVRAAAKNFKDVLVVVDPEDYPRVLETLGVAQGPDVSFRFELARKAFAHTAVYDRTIAAALAAVETAGGRFDRTALELGGVTPDQLMVSAPKRQNLRYGENPHQAAAWYVDGQAGGSWGFGAARILQGKGLSFTNLLDLDAAARLALEFTEPAAIVIKHTNPCGVATGSSLREAYVTARGVDPLSAFGGIVGLNRSLDRETAAEIASTFIECVVVPGVDDDARAVMAAKKTLRLVVADFAGAADGTRAREVRSILGALLVQERDRVVEASPVWSDGVEILPDTRLRVATERAPTDEEWTALRFAWRVCAHVKSNTVIFARADRAAAVGAGQMSRVDAVNVATLKAGGGLAGTVAASDAFFSVPGRARRESPPPAPRPSCSQGDRSATMR